MQKYLPSQMLPEWVGQQDNSTPPKYDDSDIPFGDAQSDDAW